jgi:hypothetical protein
MALADDAGKRYKRCLPRLAGHRRSAGEPFCRGHLLPLRHRPRRGTRVSRRGARLCVRTDVRIRIRRAVKHSRCRDRSDSWSRHSATPETAAWGTHRARMTPLFPAGPSARVPAGLRGRHLRSNERHTGLIRCGAHALCCRRRIGLLTEGQCPCYASTRRMHRD